MKNHAVITQIYQFVGSPTFIHLFNANIKRPPRKNKTK
jgi:hypothetical protein